MMAEQELAVFKAKYAQLEQELAAQKKPKLTSFKGTKFQGKDGEDFEDFVTRF